MRRIFILILLTVIVIMGCKEKMETKQGYDLQSAKSLTYMDWERLNTLKIYFGHQSVGFNILSGIRDVLDEYKLNILTVEESLDRLLSSQPVLAHTTVGVNGDPLKKIDDFGSNIQKINGKVDIAFLKLCYVDIKQTTDVKKVFDHYKNTVDTLKKEYPNVKIIHFTTPLTVDKKGIKIFIKRLFGKNEMGYEDNVARYRYNEMIRAEYSDREPLFDLASIESTNLMGQQVVNVLQNNHYTSLVEDFTDDGGHLNNKGRKVIAEQLLVYILNLYK